MNLRNHGIVAVIIREGKFLLLKDARKLMLAHWAPPHGRCNDEDSSEESSVIREVFEETNLHVKPMRKLWTSRADTKIKTVSFWLVDIIGGRLKIDKKESSNYGWFTLRQVLRKKLYPGTSKFFKIVESEKIKIN